MQIGAGLRGRGSVDAAGQGAGPHLRHGEGGPPPTVGPQSPLPQPRLLQLLDAVVWQAVRAKLGGHLRLCISGAAPLPVEVVEFVRMMGVTILEGYGLTETSPLISANGMLHDNDCEAGTVGTPVPGVQVTIDTRGWESKLCAGEGEVVVSGPNVMKGYWRQRRLTRTVLSRKGVFRTGDTGIWTSKGHLRITGRVKEQFKLANGRFVSPAPLEDALRLHPVVAQCLVEGRGRKHPYAIIVPDPVALEKLLRDHRLLAGAGLAGDLRALCRVPGGALAVLDSLRPLMRAPRFKAFEVLDAVILDPNPWTVANGLLTPSLKSRRRHILDRHRDAAANLALRQH